MSAAVGHQPIDPSRIRHESGHCYLTEAPPGVRAVLYEDGAALGAADAPHDRIRTEGRGQHSFWKESLYFSSSDNTDPRSNGRSYSFVVEGARQEEPLFRRLQHMGHYTGAAQLVSWDPARAGLDQGERIRLLEAKVEYLLDELYTAKSLLRHLTPTTEPIRRLIDHQKKTFDFQWGALPYHDEFLTNPQWRETAHEDVAARLGRPPEWFKGKRILDCGCGPGRHVYAFAKLGAKVTAFDTSKTGLAKVREMARDLPGQVEVFEHDILQPIPAARDFDLVWCYGVVHCTGDTFAALKNIAGHVRPGGLLYFMVYTEPRRDCVFDYTYYHEIYSLRQALVNMPLGKRAEVIRQVEGDSQALAWFDAISSEINDLFTTEELFRLLSYLGFEGMARTMPHETMQNVVAKKRAA